MSKPQVHWAELPCELCKKNTLSTSLDKVVLMIKVWGDKYSHSEHWACEDCRKKIKEQENQVQLNKEVENE
mgnify:CR=1 FL=1